MACFAVNIHRHAMTTPTHATAPAAELPLELNYEVLLAAARKLPAN